MFVCVSVCPSVQLLREGREARSECFIFLLFFLPGEVGRARERYYIHNKQRSDELTV